MAVLRPAGRSDAFRALSERRGRAGERLVGRLARSREGSADGPGSRAPAVAAGLGLPAAAALGPAAHHADLVAPRGRRHVRARLVARIGEQTAPGQVFCSFHSPASGVDRLTSHHADTVTSCPEYKVTAVRVNAS